MRRLAFPILALILAVAGSASTALAQDPGLPDPDRPPVSADVVITYEFDTADGTVEYDRYGGALPSVECIFGWTETFSDLSGSEPDRHEIRYEISYEPATITATKVWDGDRITRQIVCAGALLDAPGLEVGWETERFTDPEGVDCSGAAAIDERGLAPLVQTLNAEATPDDGTILPCVEASGGGSITTGDLVPLTGQVTAHLEDDQGRTITVQTCTLVAGSCWGDGSSFNETVEDAGPSSVWDLDCTARTLFGIRMPTAGSFGCRAWLD